MAEAISTSTGPRQGRIRFARVAAGTALALAVGALIYGQFALVAAALVCAAIGTATAAAVRDVYSVSGSVVATVIAVTSPTASAWLSTFHADQVAAEQAKAVRVSSAIAEVEAFDTRIRGYQPDVSTVGRHAEVYGRISDMLTRGRDKLLYARSVNSPDQSTIYNQMIALANQADIEHNQIMTIKNAMDQKIAALPGKWSHIQELCSLAKVRDSDACARARVDYAPFRARVAQAVTAVERDEAAFSVEKPRQQAIMDGLN